MFSAQKSDGLKMGTELRMVQLQKRPTACLCVACMGKNVCSLLVSYSPSQSMPLISIYKASTVFLRFLDRIFTFQSCLNTYYLNKQDRRYSDPKICDTNSKNMTS